ncbi:16S rRNA (guanine527-N7)-methyltransferase [Nakamurella sp. UYEF19]|uniref:16S rRNA (guanine(527)-N(7))-methyltransferase RsmG n=1 Tax=Nakamurella sp. UYEF19 TaxID=1756392 RepID=UPI0033998AF5
MTGDQGDAGGVEIEPAVALAVFGDRIGLARRYALALGTDGVVRGLIGPREAGRLWTRHILNSAVVGSLLSNGQRVVDIGSGAGLPGIPLAIARPDCSIDLVEPLERRCIFLQEMVDQLGLVNCRVIRGRAEQVLAECGGADVVTSRAVAPLAKLAAWSAPLLRVGGKLLALKGSSAAEEIERDRLAVQATGLVDLAVLTVGAGALDPETVVISGRRIATAPAGRPKKAKPSRRA